MTEVKRDDHEQRIQFVDGLFDADALKTLLRNAQLTEDPSQFKNNLIAFVENLADTDLPEGGFKGAGFDRYALRVHNSLNVLSILADDNSPMGDSIATARKEADAVARGIIATIKGANKFDANAYFTGENPNFEQEYSKLLVPLLQMGGLHERLSRMAREYDPDLSDSLGFESELAHFNGEKYQDSPLAHAKGLHETLDELEKEIKSQVAGRTEGDNDDSIVRLMIAHEFVGLTLLSTGIATQVSQELQQMKDGIIKEDGEKMLVASRVNAALMQAIAVNRRSLLLGR